MAVQFPGNLNSRPFDLEPNTISTPATWRFVIFLCEYNKILEQMKYVLFDFVSCAGNAEAKWEEK